jgi:hypothetical protein
MRPPDTGLGTGIGNGTVPPEMEHDPHEWPEWFIPVWDGLNDAFDHTRKLFQGPWGHDAIYPNRIGECVTILSARDLSLQQIEQLVPLFPHGFGCLPNSVDIVRQKWADQHGKQPGPDFGETLPFTMFADIKPSLEAGDFVEDLLTSGSLVVVYGEPGSGKTFWVLDLALHVANGRRYRDREVDQGAMIYLALEGGHGIRNRIAATRAALEMTDDTPLILVQCPVDLCTSDADVPKVIATIKTVAHRTGMPVRGVVVDTLSRALGGGNENGPEDMGALVRNSDIIRDKTGALTLYIHHCGKDAARGARGHSLLKGATDTEIEVTGANGDHLANVTRQRDLPTAGEFNFKLKQIVLGTNRRGKPVTSCIVEHTEAPEGALGSARGKGKPKGPTGDAGIALEVLANTIVKEGQPLPGTDGFPSAAGMRGTTELAWRREFYRRCSDDKSQDAKRQAFHRGMGALRDAKLIAVCDGMVWLPKPESGLT